MQSNIYIPGTFGLGDTIFICSLSMDFILFASLKLINSYLLQLSLMPSTRKQKAEARKSREMDMMSGIDNLDVMLGSGNKNPIERELVYAIEQSSVQGDYGANEYQRSNYRNFLQENEPLRQNEVRQSFETFTNEFNLRLSRNRFHDVHDVHGSNKQSK